MPSSGGATNAALSRSAATATTLSTLSRPTKVSSTLGDIGPLLEPEETVFARVAGLPHDSSNSMGAAATPGSGGSLRGTLRYFTLVQVPREAQDFLTLPSADTLQPRRLIMSRERDGSTRWEAAPAERWPLPWSARFAPRMTRRAEAEGSTLLLFARAGFDLATYATVLLRARRERRADRGQAVPRATRDAKATPILPSGSPCGNHTSAVWMFALMVEDCFFWLRITCTTSLSRAGASRVVAT